MAVTALPFAPKQHPEKNKGLALGIIANFAEDVAKDHPELANDATEVIAECARHLRPQEAVDVNNPEWLAVAASERMGINLADPTHRDILVRTFTSAHVPRPLVKKASDLIQAGYAHQMAEHLHNEQPEHQPMPLSLKDANTLQGMINNLGRHLTEMLQMSGKGHHSEALSAALGAKDVSQQMCHMLDVVIEKISRNQGGKHEG